MARPVPRSSTLWFLTVGKSIPPVNILAFIPLARKSVLAITSLDSAAVLTIPITVRGEGPFPANGCGVCACEKASEERKEEGDVSERDDGLERERKDCETTRRIAWAILSSKRMEDFLELCLLLCFTQLHWRQLVRARRSLTRTYKHSFHMNLMKSSKFTGKQLQSASNEKPFESVEIFGKFRFQPGNTLTKMSQEKGKGKRKGKEETGARNSQSDPPQTPANQAVTNQQFLASWAGIPSIASASSSSKAAPVQGQFGWSHRDEVVGESMRGGENEGSSSGPTRKEVFRSRQVAPAHDIGRGSNDLIAWERWQGSDGRDDAPFSDQDLGRFPPGTVNRERELTAGSNSSPGNSWAEEFTKEHGHIMNGRMEEQSPKALDSGVISPWYHNPSDGAAVLDLLNNKDIDFDLPDQAAHTPPQDAGSHLPEDVSLGPPVDVGVDESDPAWFSAFLSDSGSRSMLPVARDQERYSYSDDVYGDGPPRAKAKATGGGKEREAEEKVLREFMDDGRGGRKRGRL